MTVYIKGQLMKILKWCLIYCC